MHPLRQVRREDQNGERGQEKGSHEQAPGQFVTRVATDVMQAPYIGREQDEHGDGDAGERRYR